MERQYISMDNLKFLLFDVHQVERLLSYKRFNHISGREEINMMIDAAKNIADKEFFPYFREMDENPVTYKDGKVKSHPHLSNILKSVAEGGWLSGGADMEHGGMQLPAMVFFGSQTIFIAANSSAQGYMGLTTGSANLITSFGSKELIDTYVPHMFAGKWQGTMALTEPQAGSSLSDITTTATPAGEGHYEIKGQKIFISAGEHEACENFVHLTLARIKGAPAGTKGISLFVVPKYLPTSEEGLEYNHVVCAADFKKLGQRGYATTHLVFGDTGITKGFLVGEPNQGLKYMFQMMNEARIGVGQTAAAVASAAYYASLHYAMERPQGRPIGNKDLNQEQTLIINHADVRRMLLLQKAIVEGAFSLGMECLKLVDLQHATEGEESTNYNLLLELLTPIMKTYPSEMGIRSVNNAVQVLGGYGFTMDFDLQQYYRDIRIMAIYEGTTGIQSIDLLGRKVTMNNGKALELLVSAIHETIDDALTHEGLQPYAKKLKGETERVKHTLQGLMGLAMSGKTEQFLADATVFMEMTSIIVIGWQWLKQGVKAQQVLLMGKPKTRDLGFYESKLHTMKFYFKYELPKTMGLAETLLNKEQLTITTAEKELLV